MNVRSWVKNWGMTNMFVKSSIKESIIGEGGYHVFGFLFSTHKSMFAHFTMCFCDFQKLQIPTFMLT